MSYLTWLKRITWIVASHVLWEDNSTDDMMIYFRLVVATSIRFILPYCCHDERTRRSHHHSCKIVVTITEQYGTNPLFSVDWWMVSTITRDLCTTIRSKNLLCPNEYCNRFGLDGGQRAPIKTNRRTTRAKAQNVLIIHHTIDQSYKYASSITDAGRLY